VPQLADIDAPIYTDLLVHDMGAENSDGLQEFDAGTSEWRTPPLIGLRFLPRYMHDGRADTVEQAIEKHVIEAVDLAKRIPRWGKKRLIRMINDFWPDAGDEDDE
jgi:CxxC motif-containing protein (DUF1111 family)